MPVPLERRHAPRIALDGRPGARSQAGLSVRLADLSTIGARLTHFAPFDPGTALTLQLPLELDGMLQFYCLRAVTCAKS